LRPPLFLCNLTERFPSVFRPLFSRRTWKPCVPFLLRSPARRMFAAPLGGPSPKSHEFEASPLPVDVCFFCLRTQGRSRYFFSSDISVPFIGERLTEGCPFPLFVCSTPERVPAVVSIEGFFLTRISLYGDFLPGIELHAASPTSLSPAGFLLSCEPFFLFFIGQVLLVTKSPPSFFPRARRIFFPLMQGISFFSRSEAFIGFRNLVISLLGLVIPGTVAFSHPEKPFTYSCRVLWISLALYPREFPPPPTEASFPPTKELFFFFLSNPFPAPPFFWPENAFFSKGSR